VTSYRGGEPLVEVVRSTFVEGWHRGSVVVLDASGDRVAAVGHVTAPIFPRSANKPMQAVGMLRSVGLDETALRCPPDLPIGPAARAAVFAAGGGPARVQMNCSGKHAGMLLTCRAAGWPLEEYGDPAHPLQARLRAAVESTAGEPVAAVGVDGCGAALFAASLTGLAAAYLSLVHAERASVERTVADAMRAHPELVSGTGTDDAALMRGVPGLLAKGGAEGVLAAAVPGVGAVALKIDDGGQRARMPVLVAALRRLGVDEPVLDALAEVPVLGGGEWVGALRCLW
jgi:L-asparaginase II